MVHDDGVTAEGAAMKVKLRKESWRDCYGTNKYNDGLPHPVKGRTVKAIWVE